MRVEFRYLNRRTTATTPLVTSRIGSMVVGRSPTPTKLPSLKATRRLLGTSTKGGGASLELPIVTLTAATRAILSSAIGNCWRITRASSTRPSIVQRQGGVGGKAITTRP